MTLFLVCLGLCLVLLAAFSRISAQHKRIRDLETQAFRDGLTGVANRRHLDMIMRQRYDEWRRYGRSFGVLLIDIDHFKGMNDRYGHLVGDRILAAVGTRLMDYCRISDLVGRWGGDEFVVLLAEANLETTGLMAERLRRVIAAIDLDLDLPITASIGATAIQDEDTLESLCGRADSLLYASKANGRNRATVTPLHHGVPDLATV